MWSPMLCPEFQYRRLCAGHYRCLILISWTISNRLSCETLSMLIFSVNSAHVLKYILIFRSETTSSFGRVTFGSLFRHHSLQSSLRSFTLPRLEDTPVSQRLFIVFVKILIGLVSRPTSVALWPNAVPANKQNIQHKSLLAYYSLFLYHLKSGKICPSTSLQACHCLKGTAPFSS